MKPNCPSSQCISGLNPGPKTSPVIRNGFYRRSSDCKKIQRFICLGCKKQFSHATHNPCVDQKKRRINSNLKQLLCSGVSQRRAAILLRVNRKTVVRRFRFLAEMARLEQVKFLKPYALQPLSQIQFDDLETSEHTQCKPLSVTLAVDPKSRKIMGFKVSSMSAKGLLVKKAFRKYGHRKDKRKDGWDQLLRELQLVVQKDATFTSDENPHYPRFLKRHHPHATHIQVKGARGCITGQGELKKLHFDPLWALNHTCAMLRANLNRLFRRTWCTTKNQKGLEDHLHLFVNYYNSVLTPSPPGWGAS